MIGPSPIIAPRSMAMSRLLLPFLGIAVAASLAAAAPVPQPNLDHEVHVVGLSEGVTRTGDQIHGGKAAVRVDRPGKTVTLVLTAYDSVTWDVTFTPQTRLGKVILGGYHRQAVRELPRHISVVEAFSENRPGLPAVRYCYRIDSAALRPMVRQIHDLTQQEIASFQGSSRFDPERPFVVDRVQSDPRLRSDYPQPTPAADLPKLEFRALHFVPGRSPHDLQASYGRFTLTGGPDANSLRPLPGRLRRLAVDPATNKGYALTNHEVFEVNLDTNALAQLRPGLEVPRMSWPNGITLDTKRGRVLIAANYLYAYTPKTGKWEALCELRWGENHDLAYHAATDTLYLLTAARGGSDEDVPILRTYNAAGAPLNQVRLSRPVLAGLLGPMPASTAQLVSAGDHLILLLNSINGPGGRGGQNSESFIYLVESKTGKAQLTWRDPER
jgi:hypothetical protein